MQLSRHFTLDELSFSQTAKAHGLDNRPDATAQEALRRLCTAVLDPLRDAVGRPIKVNSGYRGPALNARIGGSKTSQHLAGEAADLQAPGLPVIELFKTAIRLKLPFDQIIYEANGSAQWVHLSHRAGANRGEIRIAEFGPNGKPRAYPLATEAQALAMTEPATRSIGEPEYDETADEPPHADAAPPPPPPPAAPGTAASQPTARKPAAKKTAAKKGAAKRTAAQKAAQKAPAKQPAPKKAAAKKAASKPPSTGKAPAKKVAAKKAPAKQAAPKKVAAKKVAAKKVPARKTAPTRTAAQRPAARKRVAR